MAFSPKRVLVATDFSVAAMAAADAAADLARAYGAELTLLHVTPLTARDEYPIDAHPSGEVFQFERSLRRAAARQGEAERARLEARGARVTFESIDGPAAMQIVLAAERGGYDLIVVGAHGRTGLNRILLGSVAEAVVRRATVPVLTIREPQAS